MSKHIVIIGGGHAAAQVITSLKQKKFIVKITLVSDEDMIPYQRPPLSKAYLARKLDRDRLPIIRQSLYDKMHVDLRLNTTATGLNTDAKIITLSSGEKISYDDCIIATGGHARRLDCAGSDLGGIHYIRKVADVDTMLPNFEAAKNIVIVGGGYIGLEIAAVARKLDKTVTVLEAMPRILGRVVAPEVSSFYQTIHTDEGVDIHTDQMVTAFNGQDSTVTSVTTQTGNAFKADLVIIGIGLIANTGLAVNAGIACHDMGIFVDTACRTSAANVYAVGDVTWQKNLFYDQHLRLESVQNAVDQAKIAVANIIGEPAVYNELPWFWSDQYGLKLQITGLSEGYDKLITRGDPRSRSVAFFYMKNNRIIAADCINRMQEFIGAKKIIAARVTVPKGMLQDDTTPFKDIVKKLLTD